MYSIYQIYLRLFFETSCRFTIFVFVFLRNDFRIFGETFLKCVDFEMCILENSYSRETFFTCVFWFWYKYYYIFLRTLMNEDG